MSDRIGRKNPIVLSTLAFILCYSILILASTWIVAAVALTVFWVFSGLQSPSFNSMIAESVIEQKRPKAFATYSFLMNLGWAVGPLIGAFLIPLYGFQILFLLGLIISMVCFIARLLFLQEPYIKKAKSEKISKLKMNSNVAHFIAGCSMFGFASGVISPVTAPYAEKVINLSLVDIELMFFTTQFATSFASVLSAVVVERLGGKRSLAASFLCSGLGITIWAFSPSFIIATVLMTFFSFSFYSLYDVAYGTLLSSLTTTRNRAATFGIAALVTGLSTSAGSTLGSYLWKFYAPIAPHFY